MTKSLSHLIVEKLDGRHKGSNYFSHRIRVAGPLVEVIYHFNSIREWCWSTWNPSFERESILKLIWKSGGLVNGFTLPKHWSWHIDRDGFEYFIYLRTPEDLTMFELKWM